MSLGTSRARLAAMTKELWLRWEQTKDSWKDAKSEQFERRYMSELVAGVDKAVAVIEQVDRLITKVKSDCE